MQRLSVAVLLGAACVGSGGCLRAYADSWSRNVRHHVEANVYHVHHFDAERYEFLREVGAWSVGFGLAVLAVSVGAWVSREPLAPPKPTHSEAADDSNARPL